MRVEGSGYRQKAADQPFNLLKIAGVIARERACVQAPEVADRPVLTRLGRQAGPVVAPVHGKQSSKATVRLRLHCDRFR